MAILKQFIVSCLEITSFKEKFEFANDNQVLSEFDDVMFFQMFEERPIWSKNALRCMVDLSSEQFKYVLPTLAYYCVTGPWRTLWVKLGYDPRKDPKSKMFQTLDFRIRQSMFIWMLLFTVFVYL